MRLLYGAWLHHGSIKLKEFAVKCRRSSRPQGFDGLERFIGPSATRAEWNTTRVILRLKFSPKTNTQQRSAIREMLKRGDRFGNKRWVTQRKQQDAGANPDTSGPGGKSAKRSKRVEDWTVP